MDKGRMVRVYAETCHAAPLAYRLYMANAELRARETCRKSRSLLLLQPVFRRISDREAFLFCGLQRVSNPDLISCPVIIIRVYNGGDEGQEESRLQPYYDASGSMADEISELDGDPTRWRSGNLCF
jgi:hypothetical protein